MARPKTRKIEKIAVATIAEPAVLIRSEDKQSDAIQDLARSIKANGQIEPIIVRPAGDGYSLVVGWRRLQACKYAELPFIDAEVRDIGDEELIQLRWAENEDRLQVNPADECRFIVELKTLTGKKQAELAQMIGKTEGYVSQRLAVAKGYPEILERLQSGEISFAQARELVKFPTPESAERYAHICRESGASETALRRWRMDEEQYEQSPSAEREEYVPDMSSSSSEPNFFCECCREQKYMRDINVMKLCPECKGTIIEAVTDADAAAAGN